MIAPAESKVARNPKNDLESVTVLIEHYQDKMTAWELDFVDGVHDRLSSGGSLTREQGVKLDELWSAFVVRRLR
jgi:hypothetical protein